MKLDIRLFHLYPRRVTVQLEETLMALEDLRREVAESRGAVDSAITLINGLRDRLDEALANANSYTDLQNSVNDLSVELSGSTDALAAAVAGPAAPAEEVPAETAPTGEPATETPSEAPAPLELDEDGVPVGTGGPGVQPTESEGPVENGNVNPGGATE